MTRSVRHYLRVVVAVLLTVVVAAVPMPPAMALEPQEGPDYKFRYLEDTDPPVRYSWHLYGGSTNLPYFVHEDVVQAGFLNSIQNAFATYENDPGSNVSFEYMGTTTVESELQGNNFEVTDDINVVSFGSLPGGAVGRGGTFGPFNLVNGLPDGTGDARFDITISNAHMLSADLAPAAFDVESLVLHELGHVLWLQHPDTNTAAVMRDVLAAGTAKRALTDADRAGLAELYPADFDGLCQGQAITIDMTIGASGVGTAGDDVILGTSGPDTIDAGAGNDTVCAGAGDDTVVGGEGNDTILGQDGGDVLRGGPGEDIIDGGLGDDRVLGGIGGDTLVGGQGADFLGGFGGDDAIDGGSGNDTVFGGFGGDSIVGGPGNDTMRGLIGDDVIDGGPGNDELYGDRGNDTIRGGSGNDLINGGNANDQLFGQDGDDELNGGKADDVLSGGDGTDVCSGNKQNVADVAFLDCEKVFGTP